MPNNETTVLVTGVSGYIARRVAKGLLERGYIVRGSVRALGKGDAVKQDLNALGVDTSRLSFVEANLTSHIGWNEAVEGCTYIQHIASPFPAEQPTDREALVPEARAGTQRVLAAGFAAGVKHIVMTSSIVAMRGRAGGPKHKGLGEKDWSNPEWKALSAYEVSKTRAEMSAWDYVRVQGFEDRFTAVNPGFVLGPGIGNSYGASVGLIEAMFKGQYPRTPRIAVPIVDVRDLADLHIEAMERPETGGRRLIGAGETLYLSQIADILRAAYPQQAGKLPKGDIPDFVVRIMALFDDSLKGGVSGLGTYIEVDTAYVTDLTGVTFGPAKESVLDTAAYLEGLGKIG